MSGAAEVMTVPVSEWLDSVLVACGTTKVSSLEVGRGAGRILCTLRLIRVRTGRVMLM